MRRYLMLAAAAAMLAASGPARADEGGMVTYKAMTVETALAAAKAALESCRNSGFQVSVAVVDRFGNTQVLLRDRFAGPHTPDTARRKAWTAVSFRTNTTDLLETTAPGKPQAGARDITGALMLGGGLKIESAGSIVGGIGVSGAPGGEKDDTCAQDGIASITEALSF